MGAGEPKAEWYASINPNGRMPAVVHVKDDGTTVTVFESAACLLYMASEFDKEHKLSYPIGTPDYWTQLSWVSSSAITHKHVQMFKIRNSFHGRLPATAQ
jgi:glutathione S-transferase